MHRPKAEITGTEAGAAREAVPVIYFLADVICGRYDTGARSRYKAWSKPGGTQWER
jgi:hypothetical protein